MVSHDRYLIGSHATIVVGGADHAVTSFDGDLTDTGPVVLCKRALRASPRDAATMNAVQSATGPGPQR